MKKEGLVSAHMGQGRLVVTRVASFNQKHIEGIPQSNDVEKNLNEIVKIHKMRKYIIEGHRKSFSHLKSVFFG